MMPRKTLRQYRRHGLLRGFNEAGAMMPRKTLTTRNSANFQPKLQ